MNMSDDVICEVIIFLWEHNGKLRYLGVSPEYFFQCVGEYHIVACDICYIIDNITLKVKV